jgi:hypothetical protein
MKNYFFSFFIFTISIALNAQNGKDFVGKYADLYLNATVKPIEISEKLQIYSYKNFYLQFDTVGKVLTKKPIDNKKSDFKPFQTGESYSPISDYSKLVGMEFKVTNVYEESGQYGRSYVLALKNELLGTIYYEYNTRYSSDLELSVVGSLQYPEGYWCNKLESKKDEFTGEISIKNPYTSNSAEYIYKIINKSDTTFYLSLKASGSTVSVDGKGVIILFENGLKLEKPDEKIDVKVGKNDYDYSCFIELSKEDLQVLRKNKITKYRLYIYDTNVSSFGAESLVGFINCIIDK